MVSLPHALRSTPVSSTPRPASTFTVEAAPQLAASFECSQLGSTLPRLSIEFLLMNGTRRRYQVGGEMTVGRVKEAVWGAWPEGKQPT